MITQDAPPPIVWKSTAPTTTEKAALAVLSLIDVVQTENWLHEAPPNGHPWKVAPREEDPLLGAHPSLLRMAATGVAVDEIILHVRSPFVRRLSIGLEATNVVRNVFVMRVKM